MSAIIEAAAREILVAVTEEYSGSDLAAVIAVLSRIEADALERAAQVAEEPPFAALTRIKQAGAVDGLGPEKQREIWRRALLSSRGEQADGWLLMSDIIEAAARALWGDRWLMYTTQAKTMLAAVTPLIRAAALEEAAEVVDTEAALYTGRREAGLFINLSERLRALKEQP